MVLPAETRRTALGRRSRPKGKSPRPVKLRDFPLFAAHGRLERKMKVSNQMSRAQNACIYIATCIVVAIMLKSMIAKNLATGMKFHGPSNDGDAYRH